MDARKMIGFAVCLIVAIAATDWVSVHGQAAPGAQAPAGAPRNRERRLVYAAVPGSLDRNYGGSGVLVFDAGSNWRLVKRFHTWDYPASVAPDMVRGINASVATGMLYITIDGRIGAWDLKTEKKVWEETYGGECCDRASLSPDGKTLYIPAENAGAAVHGESKWYIVDAMTGKLLKTVPTPASIGPHNTVVAPDGSRVFMAGYKGNSITVFDPKAGVVTGTVTFSNHTRPYTTNSTGTLLFTTIDGPVNGFEIGDVKTGKVLHSVEVAGFPSCGCSHGMSGHGIAMTPDEKEIWKVDGNGYIHVFDATVMPPKQKTWVKLRGAAHWVTIGLDGKYVYPASGDVIDAATKKVVGEMNDETGLPMRSEKLVELAFDADGKLIRAVDQFGVGQRKVGTN